MRSSANRFYAPGDRAHSFYFTRIAYSSGYGRRGRGGGSWATDYPKADQQFHFLQSQTVVLDAGLRLEGPAELPAAVLGLSTGSIFYHVIDARRRTPDRVDDFTEWLRGCGYEVTPMEFVPSTHTPKNTLIRAWRRGAYLKDALVEYVALRGALGGAGIKLEEILPDEHRARLAEVAARPAA